MADQQRTEKATPRRRKKAREEGRVAKSSELTTAVTFFMSFIFLYLTAVFGFNRLTNFMHESLKRAGSFRITPGNLQELVIVNLSFWLRLVIPLMMVLGVVGFTVEFLQTGAVFSSKRIKPDLSRLNPVKGFRQLFSLRSLVLLVKALIKATAIFVISYLITRGYISRFLLLGDMGIREGVSFLGDFLFRMGMTCAIVLLFLGIGDYIYQRWDYERNLRMTKQEVREEYKEIEGDPLIRQKRRERQRALTMNRMIQALPDADVVITNPTHVAVALKYDLETMEVPVVVAKGEGYIARKIKEKAEELGIEIVENPSLARALLDNCEVGDEIPPDLYQAVAEVLAFVYNLQRG